MRVIAGLIFLFVFVASSTGCSSKESHLSEKEYQRSNSASQKALDRLDRE